MLHQTAAAPGAALCTSRHYRKLDMQRCKQSSSPCPRAACTLGRLQQTPTMSNTPRRQQPSVRRKACSINSLWPTPTVPTTYGRAARRGIKMGFVPEARYFAVQVFLLVRCELHTPCFTYMQASSPSMLPNCYLVLEVAGVCCGGTNIPLPFLDLLMTCLCPAPKLPSVHCAIITQL